MLRSETEIREAIASADRALKISREAGSYHDLEIAASLKCGLCYALWDGSSEAAQGELALASIRTDIAKYDEETRGAGVGASCPPASSRGAPDQADPGGTRGDGVPDHVVGGQSGNNTPEVLRRVEEIRRVIANARGKPWSGN